jgi:Glycosyl hydrolases family 35/Beta-galactosidase jelly roll domain
MPMVTYDGRSFLVDGRRIWLVAGSITPSRVPRGLWADRVHAAKLGGLNTIVVPIFWNQHEPRPGQFDFEGQQNIREFVQLVGRAGLMCILKPGPYVGEDWDLGGIPPWVQALKDVKLRTVSQPFLEVCSRYISALAEQLRDLQVTSPGNAGPIVLVQNESSWTCGDDKLADGYLGELNRYLRESGFSVPFINANNLWQGIEGEVDGWVGGGDLLSTMRQLRTVKPDQPRVVVEFESQQSAAWGEPAPAPVDGDSIEHRLVQILASGSQYCIEPYHGGTNFGFHAGRRPDRGDAFVTTSQDRHAPLTESGLPGPSYTPIRLISTFASKFGRLLANLDPAYHPVVISPVAPSWAQNRRGKGSGAGAAGGPGAVGEGEPHVTVVHTHGVQGGVAFMMADGPCVPGQRVELLLSDGSTLAVPMGGQRVAWCLLGASLGGRLVLDYSNVSVLGMAGRVLVCFGPSGERAHLSINGGPVELDIPAGKVPTIHEHEGVVLVLCNEEIIQRTYMTEEAVWVGVAGLTPSGEPIGINGSRSCLRVGGDGVSKTVSALAPTKKPPAKLSFDSWSCAETEPYITGQSARYATIDGPADLIELGCPFGLGWYRIRIKNPGSHKAMLMAPQSGDRLHVFFEGKRAGVLGLGPGASLTLSAGLERGVQTIVVLAENLGRASGGAKLADLKGLYGHVLEVHPIKLGKAAIETGDQVDLLSVQTPLWQVHPGDVTRPERLTWSLGSKKRDIVLVVRDLPVRGVLLAGGNGGKPVRFIERGGVDQIVLESKQLGAGSVVQFAPAPESTEPRSIDPAALAECFEAYEIVQRLTEKGEWAFARWEAPPMMQFGKGSGKAHGPSWWRGIFTPAETDAPLFFEASGLTKGQLYVNDHHVGRYFVATANGKPVGPQTRYYIPKPWLKPGVPNTVLIFEEHGGQPGKAKLVYDVAE